MKRFGLLMLVLLVVSAPAFGREPVGDISIYADAAGNSCNITDNGGGGLLQIYVVHKFRAGEGATGCRFMVQPPAGSNWVYIAFSTTFTAVGAPNSDVSLGYGPCQQTDVNLGSILYTSAVASPACGYITILPGFLARSSRRTVSLVSICLITVRGLPIRTVPASATSRPSPRHGQGEGAVPLRAATAE
jgi:hypothetical protein